MFIIKDIQLFFLTENKKVKSPLEYRNADTKLGTARSWGG